MGSEATKPFPASLSGSKSERGGWILLTAVLSALIVFALATLV
jgi:hypothetical protein